MTSRRTARLSAIPEGWEPSPDDIAYAESKGVPLSEAERFRTHHLAHGTLMASWRAAWQLWCQNAVRFGHATGQRTLPLLALVHAPATVAVFDPADEYGIGAWSTHLPGTQPDEINGRSILTIGGQDLVATAREVCEAAGFERSWRGDLSPVAEWLAMGIDPELIIAAVRTSRKPEKPTLRYFDARVRALLDQSKRA